MIRFVFTALSLVVRGVMARRLMDGSETHSSSPKTKRNATATVSSLSAAVNEASTVLEK